MQEPEWRIDPRPVPYLDAITAMEARVAAIASGQAGELVWLLEHPALYTAGSSAKPGGLITPRFPVYQTGRGGQITYHGPGQRVVYAVLDLRQRGHDVRRHVCDLERWGQATLAHFGVKAETRQGRVGLWVSSTDGKEDKIMAVGVRVRRWVAYHGIALNINPNLDHFKGIVPCGIQDARYGVTSMAALGKSVSLTEVDQALQKSFEDIFNRPQR